MSGKQAKRERRDLRRRGEVPSLDAKRAARLAEFKEGERQKEAEDTFRRERPEQHAAQQRIHATRLISLMSMLGVVGIPGMRMPQ